MMMNKKKVIAILMATTIIFNIGCTVDKGEDDLKSKEIVFEENVLQSSNSSVKITQEEIKINSPEDTRFDFRFFKEGKIYGSLSSILDNVIDLNQPIGYPRYGAYKENLYILDEEYNVNDTGLKLLVEDESEGVKGINSLYYGEDRNSISYYNYETNELVEVARKKYEAFFGYIFDPLHNGIENAYERLIKGNDDFGYVVYNYSKNEEKLTQLQVIDIVNSSIYNYEVKGEDIDFIVDVVFDNITDSFYAIGNKGIVYNMSFNNDEIILEEKEKLDLSGIALWDEDQISINENGEIIIAYKFISNQYAINTEEYVEIGSTLNDTIFAKPIYDERVMGDSKDSNELLITYNPSTNTVKRIMQNVDKNYEVISFLGDSSLCLIEKDKQNGYNQEFYIGELKDDRIEIYNKIYIDTEEDKSIWVYNYIIDESNGEILINFRTSNLLGDFYTNEWEDKIIKLNIER